MLDSQQLLEQQFFSVVVGGKGSAAGQTIGFVPLPSAHRIIQILCVNKSEVLIAVWLQADHILPMFWLRVAYLANCRLIYFGVFDWKVMD